MSNEQPENDQQEEQHHPQHHHVAEHHTIPHPQHMHYAHPAVYGYPVDPAWHQQAMFHHHHGIYQGYPHPLQQHMEGVPLPPGIPGLGGSTDPLEAILGPFPCAKLRNMPFDASIEDILVLFQGLVVIDVLMVGAGEAFVIFANPMDYQMALQRDRQSMGRNFVEVYSATRAEFYAAVAAQQWQEQPRPSSFDEGRVQSMDSGNLWGSLPGSAQSVSLSAGGHRSDPSQRRGIPMGGMKGGLMPGRGAGPHAMKRSGGGIQVGEHTGFLRMRGLPFSASAEDIASFFAAYNPIPESIVLTYRSDGRATGEAYVGFASPLDSERAMELHRKSMGTRYIELFLSNKEEHGRALARFGNR